MVQEFEKLTGTVGLAVFAAELGGETHAQTVALIREVAALSDKIEMRVLNPYIDRDEAQARGIEQGPAVVVEGAAQSRVVFLGIPGGYEFANLIDSIIVASTGEPGLSAETVGALAGLQEDVTIKVFTTPT